MIYAMNALQEEVTVCEAYYAVVGRCVEEDADLSKQMQSAEDVLEKEAVVVGKSIGMTNVAYPVDSGNSSSPIPASKWARGRY